MSISYTEDQLQIKLLNELYRLQNNTTIKNRTIVLYDLFTNKAEPEDQIALQNLHTFAQVILDNKLKVKIEKEEIDDSTINRYSVIPDEQSQVKISKKVFELEPSLQNEEPGLDNIWIYELEEELRVVVIPIQKDMIDISRLKDEQEQDFEDQIKFNEMIKEQGIYGEQMKQLRKKRQQEKNLKFQERCKFAAEKHLKMFRIEAFLGTVLEKTEYVSLACLAQLGNRRFKEFKYFKSEFDKLFTVPQNFIPQYILPGFTPKKKNVAAEINNPDVTAVFSSTDGKFGVDRFSMLQKEYFFKKDGIRTKIYQGMQKNDNKAINYVIQDFVNKWNKITRDTAFAFASVIKHINSSMIQQKSMEELNVSFDSQKELKDVKEPLVCCTFDQIFSNYIMESLWLEKSVPLQKFYTSNRLKSIKHQPKEMLIPPSIQNLVFSHFSCTIYHDFITKYRQTDVATKNDQIELLKLWRNTLQQIYQLIGEINNTLLRKQQNKSYQCQNMKRFFDFLMFTFDSLEKIKKITKQDLATSSELMSNFEQLKLKKQKILGYIIKNQKKINNDQPVHYYNLYLLMMKQNANKDIEKDMEYVYLYIHMLKAYRIASQYIDDNEKIIDAIKSLALVALKYKYLSENKRELISIYQIEKKLARLLKIIGQEEYAAKIYLKNRELYFVDKAYQQAFVRMILSNDQKAQKLITWGQLIENQLDFDLAISYYRKAFSVAKEIKTKQSALKHKIDCFNRQRKEFTEEELRPHEKFLQEGDLLGYTSKLDLSKEMKQLRVCLTWDRDACYSYLNDLDYQNSQNDDSIFDQNQSEKTEEKK